MQADIRARLERLTCVSILLFTALTPAHAREDGNGEPAAVIEVAQAGRAKVAPRRWVPGDVVSRNAARLATSAAGKLEYVAEVGTRVKAGERVAKLEDEAVRLRLADAVADVARIDSQRELAQRQLQRLERLTTNAISQTQVDEARSQLAVMSAQLEQAQVRKRVAEYDLAQTELRAPFPGIVTERIVQRGEYVSQGTAIVHVVDTVHLEARVQAPLALASMVNAGMTLPLRIGAEEQKVSVRAVVPVGDARSRQFELRLSLSNSALHVGSAIEVGLPERAAAEQVVVPRDAIVVRQDGTYLMRVRDDKAERVQVRTGAVEGNLVTVHGPVQAGDIVAVRGVERLQDGQRVSIVTRNADRAYVNPRSTEQPS